MRKIETRFTEFSARRRLPSLFSGNIAHRVSHTSAVDTTAHSIWRGQERPRMPSNPVRPHRSMHPLLPSSRSYIEDSVTLRRSRIAPFAYSNVRSGEEDETRSIGTFAKPFSSGRSFCHWGLLSPNSASWQADKLLRMLRRWKKRDFLLFLLPVKSVVALAIIVVSLIEFQGLRRFLFLF